MEKQLELIRDQQKESWNIFSAGWKKWDHLTMGFMKELGEEILNYLQPGGNQQILDIAGGTGEPGLSIAKKLNGGKVLITDIADHMLDVAKEKAEGNNILNVEFMVCDACELPFDDNSFDAVSCRFGFMFFPDMQMAANEIYRVLKPEGRFAATVWNIPEKNFWVTATMGTIMRNMNIPPPPPDTPGMFRCAKPGRMKEIINKSEFRDYNEKEVSLTMNAGTAENYWNFMTEVGAPIVAALSQADDQMIAKIKAEVFEQVHQKFPDDNLALDASALVLTAKKQ